MDVTGEPDETARISAALLRAAQEGPPRLEALWPPESRPSAVGLLPGSFDPMTTGHAALADALLRLVELVLLLYSPRTLPKEVGSAGPPAPPLLGEVERVRSLMAYARARPGLGVALCTHGLYADQAEAAARAFPGVEVVIGLGADKVLQLVDPTWYEDREAALGRLFARSRLAYAARAGAEEARLRGALRVVRPWAARVEELHLPPDVREISSRAVRRVVAEGRDAGDLVPPEVLRFLEEAAEGRRGPPGR